MGEETTSGAPTLPQMPMLQGTQGSKMHIDTQGLWACRKQHRTSDCQEMDKDVFTCSNYKIVSNGKQGGHSASDQCCLVFLEQVEQVNRLCCENKYRFFCTANPKTWETLEDGEAPRISRMPHGKEMGIGRADGPKETRHAIREENKASWWEFKGKREATGEQETMGGQECRQRG